jgi:hypothetical protein
MIICCADCRSPIEDDDAESCTICERDGLCEECAALCCLVGDDDSEENNNRPPFTTVGDLLGDDDDL